MTRPIESLHQLARSSLPAAVGPGQQQETIRLLRALGWVEAKIPAQQQDSVEVVGITFAGSAVLEIAARTPFDGHVALRRCQ